MSSLRTTRGVDTSLGNVDNRLDRKAQWGMMNAQRVLDSLFPEISLSDGNTVRDWKINKKVQYTPDTLAEKAREYFLDIYDRNQQGLTIIPDIEDFCLFSGLSRPGFFSLCSGHDQEMAICANNIRNAIATCKKQMAFDGQIPPVVFAIDFNNNHDYVQAKNQVQVQTIGEIEATDSINEIASRLPQIETSDDGNM